MLINRKAVKAFALEYAERRHHKFTRVSTEFTDALEHSMREWMRRHIDSLPSKGRTI